jgi:AcrR family transcriptional regulator
VAATRPRSTTPEGREQRERVLRAALGLFTAHGFRGASLGAVAAAVGISRQGVLHYFPSKTHLLLGVLDLRDELSIARAAEHEPGTEPVDLATLLPAVMDGLQLSSCSIPDGRHGRAAAGAARPPAAVAKAALLTTLVAGRLSGVPGARAVAGAAAAVRAKAASSTT